MDNSNDPSPTNDISASPTNDLSAGEKKYEFLKWIILVIIGAVITLLIMLIGDKIIKEDIIELLKILFILITFWGVYTEIFIKKSKYVSILLIVTVGIFLHQLYDLLILSRSIDFSTFDIAIYILFILPLAVLGITMNKIIHYFIKKFKKIPATDNNEEYSKNIMEKDMVKPAPLYEKIISAISSVLIVLSFGSLAIYFIASVKNAMSYSHYYSIGEYTLTAAIIILFFNIFLIQALRNKKLLIIINSILLGIGCLALLGEGLGGLAAG